MLTENVQILMRLKLLDPTIFAYSNSKRIYERNVTKKVKYIKVGIVMVPTITCISFSAIRLIASENVSECYLHKKSSRQFRNEIFCDLSNKTTTSKCRTESFRILKQSYKIGFPTL